MLVKKLGRARIRTLQRAYEDPISSEKRGKLR